MVSNKLGRQCLVQKPYRLSLTRKNIRSPTLPVDIRLILDVEDMAGTAGGEVKCVQEHLPGQAEDHQLVVQILLAALGDLPWPRPCTLRHAHALAHPDHLLVICILLLN